MKVRRGLENGLIAKGSSLKSGMPRSCRYGLRNGRRWCMTSLGAWAEGFCGPQVIDRLRTRLEAGQVGALRDRLRRFYAPVFDITDSGMAALLAAG
jgi:hypothetical protein